jgi:hypothetical protein
MSDTNEQAGAALRCTTCKQPIRETPVHRWAEWEHVNPRPPYHGVTLPEDPPAAPQPAPDSAEVRWCDCGDQQDLRVLCDNCQVSGPLAAYLPAGELERLRADLKLREHNESAIFESRKALAALVDAIYDEADRAAHDYRDESLGQLNRQLLRNIRDLIAARRAGK